MRDTYAPLVWQCRYSGIEVPDTLWRYVEFGRGKKYSDNQAEHLADEPGLFREFDAWTDAFATHVGRKGKVTPGQYRAYGYKPPSHLVADLKTKWRGLRMALAGRFRGPHHRSSRTWGSTGTRRFAIRRGRAPSSGTADLGHSAPGSTPHPPRAARR
jgi:hypothetical protein